ncbi:DUF4158 domain-containing protein [Deinococcus proteolyticus]|uniref:DUF4158 domain-containing protein n=1 Tax=Deinococcus proteolyticus TaxID=55148 RepID=UPI000673D495|nr:DUF4158 domain-containing protein [Deinococcus proteolyticus]
MQNSSGSLFTSAQRDQFTRFPEIDERTFSRYYLLDAADLRLVRERRRDFNKLGFAVQLTVLRHLGRGLRPGETPPEAVLAYLAEQLRVDSACYTQYAAREPTRREHLPCVSGWGTSSCHAARALSCATGWCRWPSLPTSLSH